MREVVWYLADRAEKVPRLKCAFVKKKYFVLINQLKNTKRKQGDVVNQQKSEGDS